jgi:hypothetical protein
MKSKTIALLISLGLAAMVTACGTTSDTSGEEGGETETPTTETTPMENESPEGEQQSN